MKKKIIERLKELYPDVKTALFYRNPFELLIATILSAQTNDNQVNKVTITLFDKYPSPALLGALKPEELAEYIKTIGLYKNKSKNIIATCNLLVEKHNGQVPQNREDLMNLPGVGRKTANVVLSCAFNIPSIAVDTHVFRVSNRLGLVAGKDTLETEKQLMDVIPKESWSDAHHWLIWHGRLVCKARNPMCEECQLRGLCNFEQKKG
ncbi:DNA-(apurinic or apyrimidinic site) lyase /endonuclease III [Desulfonispora thiosulfatigenes DSM 11270]|uniref:Endonuclease III n=1 Tax=Desulfonispora thiosulfatigenes DSM 11270 TaxID=656914 RepID=A0A1W1UPY5_DESTI|nr:endonuclease III [Desulfonispora thiosulfatigenes]SMB83185.1 DNA-(apurinic or apyrimidinic site) lyase /endonuclease III [Desulfonispora thiosulfatigenes DSM 11270]